MQLKLVNKQGESYNSKTVVNAMFRCDVASPGPADDVDEYTVHRVVELDHDER